MNLFHLGLLWPSSLIFTSCSLIGDFRGCKPQGLVTKQSLHCYGQGVQFFYSKTCHQPALDGFNRLLRLHCPLYKQCSLSINSWKKFLEIPRFELGAAECKEQTLPQCNAVPQGDWVLILLQVEIFVGSLHIRVFFVAPIVQFYGTFGKQEENINL